MDFGKHWLSAVLVGLFVVASCGCSSERADRREDPEARSVESAQADTATEPPIEEVADRAVDPESKAGSGQDSGHPGRPPRMMSNRAMTASPSTSEPSASEPAGSEPLTSEPTTTQPVVAKKRVSDGFQEVGVFYATDRNRNSSSLSLQPPSRKGLLLAGAVFAVAIGLLIFNQLKSGLVVGGLAVILLVSLLAVPRFNPIRTASVYGPQRGELVKGFATVTIPTVHQRGKIERPSILRLEFEEDKKKHIVLSNVEELDGKQFYEQMKAKVIETERRDVLVFIHGYNVDFDSAIRRTAQIATDLSFQGVPVCYSWPSQGSLIGYPVDENNVVWTVPHLRNFLLELAEKSNATSINIVAHSMGNRAMSSALGQISRQNSGSDDPIFDQVVLAAPDVDADHFRNELAPLLANVARHVTLYASSDDQALVASKHLHGGYPRAGESGKNLVVVRDIETIDVSGIDLSLLGHSYYGSSESILRDLLGVVRQRLPASQRTGLVSRKLNNAPYWMLPRPRVAELSGNPDR